MIAYAALAFALRPLAKPEHQFRRVYVLMMAIGNVVAIPLSVTQALCELGTFEAERDDDPPRYGLTHNIQTYNPVRVAFHEWAAIGRDLRQAKTWRGRLGYLFAPPGWREDGSGATSETLRANSVPLSTFSILKASRLSMVSSFFLLWDSITIARRLQ